MDFVFFDPPPLPPHPSPRLTNPQTCFWLTVKRCASKDAAYSFTETSKGWKLTLVMAKNRAQHYDTGRRRRGCGRPFRWYVVGAPRSVLQSIEVGNDSPEKTQKERFIFVHIDLLGTGVGIRHCGWR